MKKLFSLVLTFAVMVAVLAVPVSAASGKDSAGKPDVEQYLSLDDAGKIAFDAEAALADNIAPDIVQLVRKNVANMNYMVDAGIAYITDDFHAVSHPQMTPYRAGGVTKYDTDIWGNTLIYLNSDDTKEVIRQLQNGSGDVVGAIGGIFGDGGLFQGIYNGLIGLTVWQLENANKGDTGVIIQVKVNLDTGGQDFYIWPQR